MGQTMKGSKKIWKVQVQVLDYYSVVKKVACAIRWMKLKNRMSEKKAHQKGYIVIS